MNYKRKTLSVGSTILNGKYEILKVIHTSGMANVYMVSDSSLNKNWCLKEIIKSEAGKNKVEYRSLLQEANIMKGLNHSSIPRIVTIEQDGDSIFIIMDYVDGISIKSWIARSKRIKQDVVVTWMKQICTVMIYLHGRKHPIFYRDMKPDNVMIQGDGNIKLLDFGISVVITEENKIIQEALGTKGYAAPEQKSKGKPYDLRSDIYAMGRTMYYMLTGLNPSIIGDKIQSPRNIDSSISLGLETIVAKCTKEDPNERYQSVEEVLYALQNYDKIDLKYRKGARRKVNMVMGMFMTSIFILIGSIVPLGMYNQQSKETFNASLEKAHQTGKSNDYEVVIKLKPNAVFPYEGYIESIKQDGKFTKEEEASLLEYINPNLEELKKDEDFGSLAFNMGKLYWFYYDTDTEDTGMILSVRWFKEAKDRGFEPEEADVYYQLGRFKRDITMSVAESSDSGMYKNYWDNLVKVNKLDNGEIIGLQLKLALADTISSYSYRLKTDGVRREAIEEVIAGMNSYLAESKPSVGRATELYTSLEGLLQTLPEKLDVSYSGGE